MLLPRGLGQNKTKHLEINMLTEFLQGVIQATQSGTPFTLIENQR
jgi:hypothetical protein